MRGMRAAALAAALTVVAASGAAAGPATGTTSLPPGGATGGQPVTVTVALKGVYPIVAYEFSLLNQCWFAGRYAGHFDSSESYPLLGPWFDGPGGSSLSTQVVDLTAVPSGAVCRVSVSRGSSPVKGSTTSYAVG